MERKHFQIQQAQRLNRYSKTSRKSKSGSPYWLPVSSFYVLSFAIAIAIFFLIWAILHEGREETPWIIAGVGSSIILLAAVFLREVVLRRARKRYLRAERQLDYNLDNFAHSPRVDSGVYKISLKKNSFLIEQIKRKSEAARVLGHVPDGHWDVFELCNEYLLLNESQLQSVGVGSPRLGALRRGKEIVDKLHKFHLLNWVEIETRLLTEEANKQVELSDKIELSQRAVTAIDSALEFYPEEEKLQESKLALDEFIGSVRVSYWIELAERETFKQNYRQAISLYRDALFYLARENVHHLEKKVIADRVNAEIQHIRNLEAGNLKNVENLRKMEFVKNNEDD